MPFAQYTQCYDHTPGDKPFNKNDLLSFVMGNAAPGIIIAVIAFLTGADLIGFIAIIIQYAITITAVANQWLYHRLVCISGNQCAVGTIDMTPTESDLGEFDNDQFFDLRLMPHRPGDLYRGPNCAYATLGSAPALVQAPSVFGWQMQAPPQAGPSLDGLTETHPDNDVFLDRFQGSALLQPGSPVEAPRAGAVLFDLPYDPEDPSETTVPTPAAGAPPLFNATCSFEASTPISDPAARLTRATLHCEAEGNFWYAMKQTAALQGVAAGVGAAAGAGAGAAIGCAIGGIFGPIGCAIGAFLGFIAGLIGGALGGAYVGANAAFNSDPGDVNDANVGDTPLGQLQNGDRVIVFGTHVYDGFHEGWHEIHPLMAIIRMPPPITIPFAGGATEFGFPYVEWDPGWPDGVNGPNFLTSTDMQQGLGSDAFRAVAQSSQQAWCGLLTEVFSAQTRTDQMRMENRWTIHPLVDGCGAYPTAPPQQIT